MTPHLLVAISSHGFGHLAQVAPVINAMHRLAVCDRLPTFDLSIRSSLPYQQIDWRIEPSFSVDAGSDDFGMVMHDALRVDLVQSLRQYAALHQNWEAEVARVADHLRRLTVTHLLADAPYLTLAAAKASNIPSAAICSLNWADILEQCLTICPSAIEQSGVSQAMLTQILRNMRDAYASAAVVIRPEPAIQTTGFATITTEPLADQPPAAQRANLLAFAHDASGDYLSGHSDCWLVLASMGGIALPLHPENWPTECLGRKVIYLVSPELASRCPHAIGFNLERFGFSKMMASCDLVLTKPGYGMFVESRACGKPMLYIARDDWPESACLEHWAGNHATKLSLAQVVAGEFEHELAHALQMPDAGRICFAGADTAAALMARDLFGR
jgi:hypothetical protein